MTVRIGTIDLVDDDGTTVVQASIDHEPGAYYVDDNNDAGAFQVTIPDRAAGASSIVEGALLRFRQNGSADRTGLIERVERTVRDTIPSNRKVVVTGRDWVAEFDEAVVDPPLGMDSVPYVNLVRFDWTHPQIDTTGWSTPTWIGPMFTGDVDPLGNPMTAPVAGKYGANPEGWPDVFSGYLWSAPVNGSNSHPTGVYNYFAVEYNLTAGLFVPFFTADDQGQLAFDGALLDPGAESPTPQWLKCTASGIPEVSAGKHYIRIRAINDATYGSTNNPGAIALVTYQNIVDSTLQFLNVRSRTTQTPSVADPLAGGSPYGGWKCLASSTPPGFTPGKAFRLLFDAAQAQGSLPGWTLGCTDTLDSNGNAWPVTDALTARVNDDTLLDVLRSWAAQGFIDFAARPSTRVLDLYRWRERGNFYTSPGSPLSWGDSQAARAVITGRR